MFSKKPRLSSSLLEENDHPELDDSAKVTADMITSIHQ